jgi:hypothetical protein
VSATSPWWARPPDADPDAWARVVAEVAAVTGEVVPRPLTYGDLNGRLHEMSRARSLLGMVVLGIEDSEQPSAEAAKEPA